MSLPSEPLASEALAAARSRGDSAAAAALAPPDSPVSTDFELREGYTLEEPAEEGDQPTLLATFAAGPEIVQALAFSADGASLASATGAQGERAASNESVHEARIWDLASGRALAVLRGHREPLHAAAFSPDGQQLATASQDSTVAIWDVSRGLHEVVLGLREHVLRGAAGPATSVAFSPDGTLLAAGSDDETIRFWSTKSWQLEDSLPTTRSGICRLTFSPDGQTLAAVWQSRGPVILWDVATRIESLRLSLRSEEDRVDRALGFSPDGAQLAVLSADEVRIWDLSMCQVMVSWPAEGINSMAYSPTGKVVATVGWDVSVHAGVRLWDPATGQEMHRVRGHKLPATCVAFSPDGRLLATGARDGSIHVWQLPAELT